MNVLSNPDIQNQLWALVSVGVAWLLGSVVSWVKGQLSDSQSALLDKAETYARDAAAWALVHFPGLMSVPELASKGEDKLRDILKNQGITIPDAVWSHLTQVVEGFIVQQLAARAHPALQPAVAGTLPKAT